MISRETIRRLRGSPDWIAVESHISAVIESLDRNSDIQGDEHLIALEVIGRQRAAAKLLEILQPFLDFQETNQTSEGAKERAEDAGLDYPDGGGD